uniref:WD_REPEATS_REGION domain-containing protein n=2 Tax=Bursaphelenchus xylophilus TaxID=6326 RepID=A0A1I7S8D7_BURXY
MDKTVRVWDVTRMENEAIQFSKECVDVKFSPDGFFLAVLLLDSSVHVLSAESNSEIAIIETKLDMDIGWKKGNLAKNSIEKNVNYNRIEFSPTSKFLLIGGQSNNFSLYDFAQHTLIRRFKLTANQSIDGTNPRFDPFAYYGQQIDASDEENEIGPINTPGEARKDLSLRKFERPSIELTEFAFNPTGRSFAVVSTEGVMVFSLDKRRRFRPIRLVEGATIKKAEELLENEEYHEALLMSLALDEKDLVEKVLVTIPIDEIQKEIQTLDDQLAIELLRYLGANINRIAKIRIHQYLLICRHLVFTFAQTFKADTTLTDSITSLQFFLKTHKDLLQIIQSNKGLIDFELTQRQLNQLNREMEELKPPGA